MLEIVKSQATHGHRFAFIDCLRGYAILMVITSHLVYSYPNLPNPFRRFALLGWFGVNLFFLVSAITLMVSYQNEKARQGSTDTTAFFIRRYFRIAPAYYTAALCYTIFSPPRTGIGVVQAVGWLSFLNAWYPAFGLGAWQVVPGGWSISAEFSFYAAFPLIVAYVTTLRRAAIFVVAVILVTGAVNSIVHGWIGTMYKSPEVEIFMYNFVPNHAPVFALGILLFFVLESLGTERLEAARGFIKNCTIPIIIAAIGLFVSITFLGLPRWFSLDMRIPELFPVSIALALFIVVMAVGRPGLLINRPLAFVGKISFSAYLIHFATIDWVIGSFPSLSGAGLTRYWAIVAFCAGWLVAVGVTVAASACSYHLIEEPGMALGRSIIAARKSRLERVGLSA